MSSYCACASSPNQLFTIFKCWAPRSRTCSTLRLTRRQNTRQPKSRWRKDQEDVDEQQFTGNKQDVDEQQDAQNMQQLNASRRRHACSRALNITSRGTRQSKGSRDEEHGSRSGVGCEDKQQTMMEQKATQTDDERSIMRGQSSIRTRSRGLQVGEDSQGRRKRNKHLIRSRSRLAYSRYKEYIAATHSYLPIT